jgi:hypothetical protein
MKGGGVLFLIESTIDLINCLRFISPCEILSCKGQCLARVTFAGLL